MNESVQNFIRNVIAAARATVETLATPVKEKTREDQAALPLYIKT